MKNKIQNRWSLIIKSKDGRFKSYYNKNKKCRWAFKEVKPGKIEYINRDKPYKSRVYKTK